MEELISTLTIFFRYATILIFGVFVYFGGKVGIWVADKIVAFIKNKIVNKNHDEQ